MDAERISLYWNERARTYDNYYRQAPIRQRLIEKMSFGITAIPENYETAIDLGSGSARLTEIIARHSGVRKVWAVDIAHEMNEKAKIRLRGTPWFNCIDWVTANVFDFEPPSQVDLCVSGLLMHQIDFADKQRFLQRCFNYLKPGGMLVIADQMICDESLRKISKDPKERRSAIRRLIQEEFYPAGIPTTYRDEHECTELDCELFSRIREAGFRDIHFSQISKIVGIFFATKFAIEMVSIRPQTSSPVDTMVLPESLADSYHIVEQRETDYGYRAAGTRRSDDRRVWIDTASGGTSSVDTILNCISLHSKLQGQECFAQLLEADKVSGTFAVYDHVNGAPLDESDGIESLFVIIERIRQITEALMEVHDKGFSAGPNFIKGIIVNNESIPVITGLIGCRPIESETDKCRDLMFLGSLLTYLARRRFNKTLALDTVIHAAREDELAGDMFNGKLPNKVAELCRTLLQDRDMNCERATSLLDRFLNLEQEDRKTEQRIVAGNPEFIELWEAETAPAAALARIWENIKDQDLLRKTIYRLFSIYKSPHNRSNAFSLLVAHDFDEFRSFVKSHIKDVKLRQLSIHDRDFSGWEFDKCDIKECEFINCNFQHAGWRKTEIVSSHFVRCNLANLRSSGNNLTGVTFGDVDLTESDLSHSNLERCNIRRSRVNRLCLKGANLHSAAFQESTGIETVDLLHANLYATEPKTLAIAHKGTETQHISNYDDFACDYKKVFPDIFESVYWWLSKMAAE